MSESSAPSASVTKDGGGTQWKGAHRTLMDSFQARWNDVPDSRVSRRAFIESIMADLQKLPEAPPQHNLAKRVRAYMNNNSSNRRQKQNRKRPTLRKLLIADEGDKFTKQARELVKEFQEEQQEEQGGDSGGLEKVTFVGAYSTLVSRRMKELTVPERDAYQRRMGEWVENGPPPEAQRRAASKLLSKKIYNFSESIYREMGARVVIFGTYVNKDRQKQIACYDFNDHFGGGKKAFKSSNPDWEDGCTYQLFEQYAAEYLTGSDSDSPNPVKIVKPGLNLALGPTGVPLLPRHCLHPKHSKDAKDFSKFQRDVLRAFVNAAYSVARGMKSTAAPWSVLKMSQADYLDEKYMPDHPDGGHRSLEDPSKMSKNAVHACLQHWQTLQSRGQIPLQFSHYLTFDGERRTAKPYVPPSPNSQNRSTRKKRKRTTPAVPSAEEGDTSPDLSRKKVRQNRRVSKKASASNLAEAEAEASTALDSSGDDTDDDQEAAADYDAPSYAQAAAGPSNQRDQPPLYFPSSSESEIDGAIGSGVEDCPAPVTVAGVASLDDECLEKEDHFDYSTLDPRIQAISAEQEAARLQTESGVAGKNVTPLDRFPLETRAKARRLGITEAMLAEAPEIMGLVHTIAEAQKALNRDRDTAAARQHASKKAAEERQAAEENTAAGEKRIAQDCKAAEEKTIAEVSKAAEEKRNEEERNVADRKVAALEKTTTGEKRDTALVKRTVKSKKIEEEKTLAERKQAAAEKEKVVAAAKKAAENKEAAVMKKAADEKMAKEQAQAAEVMKKLLSEKAVIDAEIQKYAADNSANSVDIQQECPPGKPRRAKSETAKVRASRLEAEEKALARAEAIKKAALRTAAKANLPTDPVKRPKPRPIGKKQAE